MAGRAETRTPPSKHTNLWRRLAWLLSILFMITRPLKSSDASQFSDGHVSANVLSVGAVVTVVLSGGSVRIGSNVAGSFRAGVNGHGSEERMAGVEGANTKRGRTVLGHQCLAGATTQTTRTTLATVGEAFACASDGQDRLDTRAFWPTWASRRPECPWIASTTTATTSRTIAAGRAEKNSSETPGATGSLPAMARPSRLRLGPKKLAWKNRRYPAGLSAGGLSSVP